MALSSPTPTGEPVAGRDYPRSLGELQRMFPDEAACAAHLARLRFGAELGEFVCGSCGVAEAPWVMRNRPAVLCRSCRTQQRLLAGTLLDKTRTPLTTWFSAAWLMVTAKNGVSAKTLERTLGLRYRTAWTLLQRFRVAMVRAERPPLTGTVEVDETFVGGVRRGMGRGPVGKFCVALAVEQRHPSGFGRCRLRYVPSQRAEYLVPFVTDTVQPGSRLLTDGSRAYDDLVNRGYGRSAVSVATAPGAAHDYLPGVHRVASLLKRWMLGTHQGSADPTHLQSYLEEFTFRFNRRRATHRGLVFHRLLEQAVRSEPVTEHDIAGGYYIPPAPAPLGPGACRVAIAEGSPVVAALLRARLERDGRFSLVFWADDPTLVAAQARRLEPDIILVDAFHRPAEADALARACPSATVLIHDPDHLWSSADRSSRTYPVVDTCYRYDELADTLASLTEPERLPF